MDNDMLQATDEFITRRVSHHGQNETEAVNSAYMQLRSCVERLRATLTEEQVRLLRDCENAYHVADGEANRFYYMSGFHDAFGFICNFSEMK